MRYCWHRVKYLWKSIKTLEERIRLERAAQQPKTAQRGRDADALHMISDDLYEKRYWEL